MTKDEIVEWPPAAAQPGGGGRSALLPEAPFVNLQRRSSTSNTETTKAAEGQSLSVQEGRGLWPPSPWPFPSFRTQDR